MGTTHFTGLNLKLAHIKAQLTCPTSTETLTITGLAVDDKILGISGLKITTAKCTSIVAVVLTTGSYSITAANVITLGSPGSPGANYSGYCFTVIYLDRDAP